jgi:hypothetical protein
MTDLRMSRAAGAVLNRRRRNIDARHRLPLCEWRRVPMMSSLCLCVFDLQGGGAFGASVRDHYRSGTV